ncbi:MAG TPA: hypothetical protein VH854_05665 [Thermoanaerobaculia bacterium]|nr:hypothetical protein [Thermoanaerobaculia bacterium]
MPDETVSAATEKPASGPLVPGLTDPRRVALERHPIRTREGRSTLSGWRMAIASTEGEGTITRVDLPSVDGALHRGEGLFLGWPEERLAAAYAALLPMDEPPSPTLPQLG